MTLTSLMALLLWNFILAHKIVIFFMLAHYGLLYTALITIATDCLDKMRELVQLTFYKSPKILPSCVLTDFIRIVFQVLVKALVSMDPDSTGHYRQRRKWLNEYIKSSKQKGRTEEDQKLQKM
ncbi:hypothetical protein LOK49_LG12G00708 [Camellia lanceoleosa]|uniref:Uncharacterized protein n=1 Tax=Camellia lanceoleosa TaxID=1840588 RepID=A0ACC0FU99_9ERIC|nr:hypothetical protein LOK49_LG12G00708 [Camellia lanceoleosa]